MAEPTARCPRCGETKALDEFPRNRSQPNGHGIYCKPCHNANGRESIARNGGARHYKLQERYGVSEADVQALIARQGGVCAICRLNPPTHLDHDHASGATRGVLCVPCNNGLGLFRDNYELLISAAAYLKSRTPALFGA